MTRADGRKSGTLPARFLSSEFEGSQHPNLLGDIRQVRLRGLELGQKGRQGHPPHGVDIFLHSCYQSPSEAIDLLLLCFVALMNVQPGAPDWGELDL